MLSNVLQVSSDTIHYTENDHLLLIEYKNYYYIVLLASLEATHTYIYIQSLRNYIKLYRLYAYVL